MNISYVALQKLFIHSESENPQLISNTNKNTVGLLWKLNNMWKCLNH